MRHRDRLLGRDRRRGEAGQVAQVVREVRLVEVAELYGESRQVPAPASSVGGGAVTSVKFYTRASGESAWFLLGEDAAAPYARTWATDPWVGNGAYDIKAEAWNGSTLRATGVISASVQNAP